jgi:uncharacterized membrane protein YgcG
MNIDVKDLSDFERQLLKALFANFQLHEEVSLSFLQHKLAQEAIIVRQTMSDNLAVEGYFKHSPFNLYSHFSYIVYGAVAVVAFVLSFLHGTVALWAGMVVGLAIALIFIHALPARTAKGTAAKEHLLGLKMYLKVAEADRIKMMQSPGARYGSGAGQPVHNVELFEKLLPYAMVLGVEKEWAKQFADIYTTPPDWYTGGNWQMFSVLYLTTNINDGLVQAVNTTFTLPTNSGSSGFSGGGGFAGGGGGGGGGGGW